jgi:hypothetical protein
MFWEGKTLTAKVAKESQRPQREEIKSVDFDESLLCVLGVFIALIAVKKTNRKGR